MYRRRSVSLLLLVAFLFGGSLTAAPARAGPPAVANAQATPVPPDPVAALMEQLTPEQKIGQLFLVSFAGAKAPADSDISRLIREQHIGGVVLLSSNGNFVNNADAPRQVAGLTTDLQKLALAGAPGIPLFVAVDHEGDGFPYTRITGGMTSLPNAMAIGATWDPKNAEAAGEITGRELSAVGINLLLGPDADVLNNPRPTGRGDIGTRTFGGDPWWVAQMDRSYICGVHQGGGGHVATVAKHFPGHGGSDRLPDQEVATVDKSLTELKRIELPPFFAVTQAQTAGDCAVTEAMMTSHIRYRGLQGNIRQFTAPISFDGESLNSILGLAEFAAWQKTGLMVSDSLGVPAVARYFDPTERTFPHRQIAKEALMAGNDLLTISEFARPQAASLQYDNLVDTVNYFRDEYQANPLFRQRVDDAVARVLYVKLKVFGSKFEAKTILPDPAAAAKAAGQGGALVSKIARESLTMLAPNGTGGRVRPAAPRRDENILIFTDTQRARECPLDRCDWFEPLPVNAVQDTIMRLYGPSGTGQVDPARLHSVSFSDLKTYLERRLTATTTVTNTLPTPEPGKPDISTWVEQAQWIIFAAGNVDRDNTSDAVRLFLDNGLGRRVDTKLVVLAFNAPYYLDTTEVNKLALYLAAYSKMPPFIEAAVRGLFGEVQPGGHSPVNVEGVSYDLLGQLAPDPAKPFELRELSPTNKPWQPPAVVKVQTGPLVDHNGNQVPDGTDVQFEAVYSGGGVFVPVVHSTTIGGKAEATLTLREPGSVTLSARSGPAESSSNLHLAIAPPPTVPASPTSTVPPTATATPTLEPTATPTATPSPTPEPALPPAQGNDMGSRVAGLALAALGAGLAAALGFGWLLLRRAAPVYRWRGLLLGLSGGLAGYVAYILWLRPAWPVTAALVTALLAGLAVVPFASAARTHSPRR
ncbi:MAG TPA: glycoside hydrolase family 3 N-terminal domain-containing protein [Anaerolineae bacterium]